MSTSEHQSATPGDDTTFDPQTGDAVKVDGKSGYRFERWEDGTPASPTLGRLARCRWTNGTPLAVWEAHLSAEPPRPGARGGTAPVDQAERVAQLVAAYGRGHDEGEPTSAVVHDLLVDLAHLLALRTDANPAETFAQALANHDHESGTTHTCDVCGGTGEVEATAEHGAPDDWPLDWFPCPGAACVAERARLKGEAPTNPFPGGRCDDCGCGLVDGLCVNAECTPGRERFRASFRANLSTAWEGLREVMRGLTCDEADALASLYREVRLHDYADDLLACHAEGDTDEGDRHAHLRAGSDPQRETAEGLAQVANLPGEVHPLDPYAIPGPEDER